MAYEESLRSITLNADSSLGIYTGVPGQPGSPDPHGGKQYHFVKVTGVHQVGLADATGGRGRRPAEQAAGHRPGCHGRVPRRLEGGQRRGHHRRRRDPGVSADGQAAKTGAGPVVGVALSTTANPGELVNVLLTI